MPPPPSPNLKVAVCDDADCQRLLSGETLSKTLKKIRPPDADFLFFTENSDEQPAVHAGGTCIRIGQFPPDWAATESENILSAVALVLMRSKNCHANFARHNSTCWWIPLWSWLTAENSIIHEGTSDVIKTYWGRYQSCAVCDKLRVLASYLLRQSRSSPHNSKERK